MLRLNTAIAPCTTACSRLGVIGGDTAGFPNGRRLSDDVIDISLRAVLGVLLPDHQALADTIGDGVNVNDVPSWARSRTWPTGLGFEPDTAQLTEVVDAGSCLGPDPYHDDVGEERPEMKRVARVGGAVVLAAALFVAGGSVSVRAAMMRAH